MSFIHGSFLEADTKGSYCLSSMASMGFKKSARVSLLFFTGFFCFVLFCFSNCSTSKVTRLPMKLYGNFYF